MLLILICLSIFVAMFSGTVYVLRIFLLDHQLLGSFLIFFELQHIFFKSRKCLTDCFNVILKMLNVAVWSFGTVYWTYKEFCT